MTVICDCTSLSVECALRVIDLLMAIYLQKLQLILKSSAGLLALRTFRLSAVLAPRSEDTLNRSAKFSARRELIVKLVSGVLVVIRIAGCAHSCRWHWFWFWFWF